jgi:hypothetical protein
MFRLIAIAVVFSLGCGFPLSGASATCRTEVTACTVSCANPDNNRVAACKQRCRVLLCEAQPTRLAKGRAPGSDLPAAELPQTRMPDSHLY